MALLKSRLQTVRISPTDQKAEWLINKITSGENISITVEDSPFGERIVLTANKTQNRNVLTTNCDIVIPSDVYLVLADASKNHVVLTLPPASDYLGQLSIVCINQSHGIEIVPNGSTRNVIFDTSNISFNAPGDSLILVSDRGHSCEQFDLEKEIEEEVDEVFSLNVKENHLFPGTWYAVGRYTSQWYA